MASIRESSDELRLEFPAPIGNLLGLVLTTNEPGRATIEFEATERYANPMGTLHGGVLCDIADAAMGAAYRTHWPLARLSPPSN
jgi:acyl-coenzyme A thioesterase PaaI-like protein